MLTSGMISSYVEDYETPQWLFDQLDREFHFTLDPCASDKNHKCDKYFTAQDNGLEKSWGGEIVFCNPPYGKKIKHWVKKAYKESTIPGTIVVMLIPARTDTMWFHEYIMHRAEVRFINGRLRFNGMNVNAPFPSMIVIFRSGGIAC